MTMLNSSEITRMIACLREAEAVIGDLKDRNKRLTQEKTTACERLHRLKFQVAHWLSDYLLEDEAELLIFVWKAAGGIVPTAEMQIDLQGRISIAGKAQWKEQMKILED